MADVLSAALCHPDRRKKGSMSHDCGQALSPSGAETGAINLVRGEAVPDDLHLRGAVLPKKKSWVSRTHR